MTQLWNLLQTGGVLMIPIAAGSVAAVALLFERLWALRRAAVAPPALLSTVLTHVAAGHWDKATAACRDSQTPAGRILAALIDARGESRGEIKERAEEVGRTESLRLGRWIEAVGTIASLEPLLGLLGTVLGMIRVFQKVVGTSASGAVDPAQLASGIWQALVTTAAGLTVAIAAFAAYRYLQSKLERRTAELETMALAVLDALAPLSDGTPSAPGRGSGADDAP